MFNVIIANKLEIEEAIREGKLTVGVIGLGWMGLPTACLFAEAGANVVGVDTNQRVVELINSGKSPIEEPNLEALIRKNVSKKRLFATGKMSEVAKSSDVLIIVVPTLIDERKRPDYSAVENTCKNLGYELRIGCLVILESTVGPGVTEKIVKETLESSSGLKAGVDFGLAYSPIRASVGSVLEDLSKYPRVVAGIDKSSLRAAVVVLSTIVKGGMVEVKDLKTAEATKLFENVYRDVNIALANELATFCEKVEIDFDEASKAAITQPYCHLHKPGIGVGGHCIPVNPYFLIEEAEAVGVKLQLASISRKVNDHMPQHTSKLVLKALRICKKTLNRSKIAVLGLSYKPNVKEARFSPSRLVIKSLMKRGARINVYDPNFSSREIRDMGYSSTGSLDKTIEGVDCLLIAVGHDEFKKIDLNQAARSARKPASVVDVCRILDPEEVMNAGFIYFGVGYGKL